MFAELVGWRTTQCIHSPFQTAVEVPRVGGINDVLQLSLTGKELVHLVLVFVIFRQTKLLVNLLILSKCIHDLLNSLFNHLDDGFLVVELRVLWQVANGISRREDHLAQVLLVEACDDFHQRRLTRAVETDNADFGAIEETEVDVLQYLFLCLLDGFAHAHHREDYLLVVLLLCHVEGS